MSQEIPDNTLHVVSAEESRDYERRNLLQRGVAALVVAAAGASLVFEQTPANEALRVNIGLDVLQGTQSALAVGATIAGVTAAIEMGSSTLITMGLHSESNAVNKLKARIKRNNISAVEDVKDNTDKPRTQNFMGKIAAKGANIGIALGLGAGLVTLKEHMKDSDPTVAKDLKNSAEATAVISTVSGGIGYLAAGGINHATGTIMERPAEIFVDYGTDTRFWVGALTVGYGIAFARKMFNRIRSSDENNSQIQDEALPIEQEVQPVTLLKANEGIA